MYNRMNVLFHIHSSWSHRFHPHNPNPFALQRHEGEEGREEERRACGVGRVQFCTRSWIDRGDIVLNNLCCGDFPLLRNTRKTKKKTHIRIKLLQWRRRRRTAQWRSHSTWFASVWMNASMSNCGPTASFVASFTLVFLLYIPGHSLSLSFLLPLPLASHI